MKSPRREKPDDNPITHDGHFMVAFYKKNFCRKFSLKEFTNVQKELFKKDFEGIDHFSAQIKIVLDLDNKILEFFENKLLWIKPRKIYTVYLSDNAAKQKWFPCVVFSPYCCELQHCSFLNEV